MSEPLVSVIIPAFRAAPYVGEAVASVFQQTLPDFEILLVNDGSPDTADLERAIEPYRDRIIYIEQENRGPGGARNTAMSRARGEFLAFLDSDDVWLPHYLAEQIDALRLDHLDFIYADAVLFGDSVMAGKTYMATSPSHGPVTLESLLNRDCMVITTCTIVSRQAVIDAGGFDEDRLLVPCEDLDLWIRLAYNGCRMAYQRRVLARHRLLATSLIAHDELQLWTAQIRVLKKAAETLTLAPSVRETIARQILACEAEHALATGRRSFEEGRFDEALEALERANSFFRSRKLSAVMLCLRHTPRLLHITFDVRNWALKVFANLRKSM